MDIRKVAGVSPLTEDHKNKKPPLLGGVRLQASIRVNKAPRQCYLFWRNFENLPRFMGHIDSVVILDDRRSHWLVEGPADTTVEWDAEIIEDAVNERISWRSLSGAQIDNAGSVFFSPQEEGRQTEVKVTMTYNPTLGLAGDALARLFGESPDETLAEDLIRFKKTLEEK